MSADFFDVDDLLRYLIAAAAPTAQVSAEQPADLLQRIDSGYVVASRVGGAAISMGLLDRATCDVQVYAPTRRGASELAQTIRLALHGAWTDQIVTPYGHLSFLQELAAPTPIATSGAYRYQASYSLGVRTPV